MNFCVCWCLLVIYICLETWLQKKRNRYCNDKEAVTWIYVLELRVICIRTR